MAANVVRSVKEDGRPVARGEGLYWRYERLLKRLEDRVGSVVSASGHLYAVRRRLFTPSTLTAGTDDFVISSQVVRAGARLAFDERAVVLVDTPEEGGTELRRKVRVMNRGMRSALALGPALLPTRTGLYGAEVIFHKILRRFVAFFLVAALASSVVLAGARPALVDRAGPAARLLRAGRGRRACGRHALGAAEAALDPLLLLPGQPGRGGRRALAARRRALRALGAGGRSGAARAAPR